MSKKRNALFILLAATLLHTPCIAQLVGSLNTAINSLSNGVIAGGQNDLRWTSSLSSINGPFIPAVRVPNNPWFAIPPQPDVAWISYPHGCNVNDQGISGCLGVDHEEYFTATFSVACTGSYCIKWTAYSDNCVYKMYLDQTQSPFFTTALTGNFYMGYDHVSPVSGSLCANLATGTHQLYVHIKSGIDLSSLNTSYTGFMFFATSSSNCEILTGLNKQGFSPGNFYTLDPANQKMTVNCNPGELILISDIQGRTLYRAIADKPMTELDLFQLQSGINILQAGNKREKFLLQRE